MKVSIDCYNIDYEVAGNGLPLLLLHGFPETKRGWQKVVPALAKQFTVVVPDLPGYGASTGPAPDEQHQLYSKRNVAAILNRFMEQLGFANFALAGHDRGARIAYRMALDFPSTVTQVALLNIIPTLEMIERMDYDKAMKMENWLFFSQPVPFPETMISSNPRYYLNYILDSWSVIPASINEETRAEYLTYFSKPEVIATICAEYRANEIDRINDRNDREAGRRIQCPVLLLWSDIDFPTDGDSPLDIWKNWAYHISGRGFPCGHFLMEELPEKVAEAFLQFFNR
jgi:haloacetate dehalogenase